MATYRLQKIFRQEASDAALEALRADKILRLQEARAEEKRRKEENRAKLLKGAAIGAATLGGLYAANKGWLGKGMRSLTRAGISLATGKTDQAKMEWGRVGKGFQIDWRNTLGSKPAKTAAQQTQNQGGQTPVAGASQQNQGVQTSVVSTPANGGGTPAPVNGTGGQNPPVTDTSVNPTPPAGGVGIQNPNPPATDTTVVSTKGNKGASNKGGRRNNSGQGNKGGSRGNGNSQGNNGNRGRRRRTGSVFKTTSTGGSIIMAPGI